MADCWCEKPCREWKCWADFGAVRAIAKCRRHLNETQDGGFCAGENQALLFWIFAHHVDPTSGGLIGGQTGDDFRPGFAAVMRAPN